MLAEHVRQVGRAVRAQDEQAARAGLRDLANDCELLAMADPLPLGSSVPQRQRIAAESDGLGRIG
jgi:hypothetical protein